MDWGIVIGGPYQFFRGTFALEIKHPHFIANALLRITWRVTVIADRANKIFIAGITRDLVSAALDWVQFADPGNGRTFEYQFWTTAPDASAHTYGGRCWHDTAGPNSIVSFSRSTLTIEEFASRHLAKCGF